MVGNGVNSKGFIEKDTKDHNKQGRCRGLKCLFARSVRVSIYLVPDVTPGCGHSTKGSVTPRPLMSY